MAFEPDLLSRGMPDAPPPPEQQDGSLIADAGKAFTGAVVDTTAQAVGMFGNEDPNSDANKLRDTLNEVTAVIDKSISPKSQRAEAAQPVPSEGEASIFEAPVRSTVMKTARMTPMLLGALLLPPGWAGVTAGSALFGTQGIAQQLNDSHKKIMTMPEEELLEKSSLYRGLRNDLDEAHARSRLIEASNDAATLLFAGGANAAGGGALAHALKAQSAKGILKSAAVGAGDALAGGAVSGAGMNVASQRGDQKIGLQDDIDPGAAALAALNASLTSAPVGAAFGVVSGVRQRRASRAQKDAAKGTTVDPNGPTPAQTAAVDQSLNTPSDTGTPAPPPEAQVPPSNSSPNPAPAPAATNVPPETMSLRQRIDAERARQAAETQAAPLVEAPPVARTPSPEPTPVLPPVQLPVQTPAAGPLQAAEVQAAVQRMPKKAVVQASEPPIPMPPTDRLAYPPRRKGPPERTAVPLEDPALAELNASIRPVEPASVEVKPLEVAEVQAAVEAMPKKAVVPEPEPLAALVDTAVDTAVKPPAEVASAEDIAAFAPKTSSKPVVVAVKRAPRVLKKDPIGDIVQQRAVEDAAAKALREENVRAADAERKRQGRVEKNVLPNEEKARKTIEGSQPQGDDVEYRANMEDLAMSAAEGNKGAAISRARDELLGEANRVIAAAENAGIKIPTRTVWSKEMPGKNPTPFTSRLIELVKFDKLVKAAQRLEDPSVREKKLRELYQEHVVTERALRAGDLEGAAERRLAANEARDARAEIARMKAEQAEEAKRDAANSMRAEDVKEETKEADYNDDGDEVSEQGSRTRKGKADHYRVEEGGVRHSRVNTELDQLIHEFDQIKEPKTRERAQLLVQIMRKIKQVAGSTEMHFTSDRAQMPGRMGEEPDMGGLFLKTGHGTLKDGVRGDIWVDNQYVAGEGVQGPRLIIHEAAHAAMSHAIDADPKLRADIERLLAHGTVMGDVQIHSKDNMSDPHEFMSEAMANPRVQDVLLKTPAPAWMLKEWGLQPQSLWRALVSRITKALGLGEKHVTLMDAALYLGDRAMDYQPPSTRFTAKELVRTVNRQRDTRQQGSIASRAEDLRDRAVAAAPHIPGTIRNRVRGALQKVSFFHTVTDQLRPLMGGSDVPTRLRDTIARMATDKRTIETERFEPVLRRGAELERKHASGEFGRFQDFLIDETMAEVFADRPLKGQKGLTAQSKAAHPELAARHAALPDDLKEYRKQVHTALRDAQNEASLSTLKAIVRATNDGVADDALAQRIFDKTLDDAEKAVLKSDGVFRAIQNAGLLKLNGPYVPLMRHGDHVVSGQYNIQTPAGATRHNDDGAADPAGNLFRFKTKAEADKFSGEVPAKVLSERHVFVDPQTGARYGVDNDGTRVKLTKEDWAANTADEAFDVRIQSRYFEKFESEVTARQRHAELTSVRHEGNPLLTLDGVAPSHWEPSGRNATFVSHEFDRMLNSLRQRPGFRALEPQQRHEMETQLRDAALSALGTTRLQKHRIGRNFTAGASTDLMKGLSKYSSSMAGFLSRQKHRPQIDGLLKQITDYAHERRHEDTSRTYPRGQLVKEIQKRVYAAGEPEAFDLLTRGVNRLLQVSMLDKLASPAYHVINSMEPWTVSLPVLAGRHGVGQTMMAMNRVYRDIGSLDVLKQGLVNTGRALRRDLRDADYLKPISDRVRKATDGTHLQDVLKDMQEIGLISKDAGMEFRRLSDPSANPVLRGLDRADLMARQMGTAVESVNRAVTGLAAYRLEFARSKDHAASKAYAIDTVLSTMGDYAGWNAPAAFNHPLGRIALQFKKYAAKTYALLGTTAARALRGDTEAMKQFAGLMATHALLAGTLGLPLEAVKAGFIAAGMLGVTSSDYGDFEQWVRKQAAAGLGNELGQIATRGLPRYLGVDLSSRVGMESLLLPFGEPKSMKPQDLMAYGAQAFGGAPLGLLSEYPSGMKALMDGDFVKAAEKLVPLKVFADSMQAYQRATQGKQTPSGKQSLSPYSPVEAGIKALGFTPGRDAETSEMRAAVQHDQGQFRQARGEAVKRWVTATPNDKTAAWGAVQRWNASQPEAARITMKELTQSLERRKREATNPDHADAVATSRRDRHLREANSIYNLSR